MNKNESIDFENLKIITEQSKEAGLTNYTEEELKEISEGKFIRPMGVILD
jgi:hypothetical protein